MTRSDFSGLAAVKQPNDWTEVTLPHAETDDRSRPGPKRTSADRLYEEDSGLVSRLECGVEGACSNP
jgi:hypothetical protein